MGRTCSGRAARSHGRASRSCTPRSTWDPTRRDEPVLIDDRAADRWLARPGRWVVARDTLGEILIAILTDPRGAPRDLTKLQSTAAWTNTGAAGWGGDRFFLLSAGRTAAEAGRSLKSLQGVWVTAWDTPLDRDEFLEALDQSAGIPNSVALPVAARVAVVLIGMDAAERETLMRRLDTAPLPMLQDGRPWL